MTQAAHNLIGLYNRNPDRHADIQWYATARSVVRSRAKQASLPWRRYAAVIAATSNSVRWQTKDGTRYPNADAADRVIAYWRGERATPGVMPSSAKPALAILNGAAPARQLGPKTARFYRALIGTEREPVLDRWALRAIGWKRETLKEREQHAAASAYREAAAILGISPVQLQAAIWTQIQKEWQYE